MLPNLESLTFSFSLMRNKMNNARTPENIKRVQFHNSTGSEENPTSMKRIQFHIIAATGLPPIKNSRKPPTTYVSVQVSELKIPYKTGTVRRHHEPQWHENLTAVRMRTSSSVTLQVKHRSVWPRPDLVLASTKCLLSTLLEMQGGCDRETSVALPLSTEMECGTLPMLKLNIRELSSLETAAEATAAARAMAALRHKALSNSNSERVGNFREALNQLSDWLVLLARVSLTVICHDPFVSIALSIINSTIKVIGQLNRDAAVVKLMETINQAYGFLKPTSTLQEFELEEGRHPGTSLSDNAV